MMSNAQTSLAVSARDIEICSWLPLMKKALFHQLHYNKRQASSTAHCSIIYGPVRALFDDGTTSKTHWHADACLWEDEIFFDGGTFLLPSKFPQVCLDDYVVDFDLSTGIHHVNFPILSFRTDVSLRGIYAFNSQILPPEHITPSIQHNEITTSISQSGDIIDCRKAIVDAARSILHITNPSKCQSYNDFATIDAHKAASRIDLEDLFISGRSNTSPKSDRKYMLSLSDIEDEMFSRIEGLTQKLNVSGLPFPDNVTLSHRALTTLKQFNGAPLPLISATKFTASAQEFTIDNTHKVEKKEHWWVGLVADKTLGTGSINARTTPDKNFRELRIDTAPNSQHDIPLPTGQTSNHSSIRSTEISSTPATSAGSSTFKKPLCLPNIHIKSSVSKTRVKAWILLQPAASPITKTATLDALHLAGQDQEQVAWECLFPPWLNLKISQRQYDNWEEIKERVDPDDYWPAENEIPRDRIDDLSLGKDINDFDPPLVPIDDQGVHQIQDTNEIEVSQMEGQAETLIPPAVLMTVNRKLVENLPSFVVGNVPRTHDFQALDVMGPERGCVLPMPNLQSPSPYLDVESRTIWKQPFQPGQYCGIMVQGAQDCEPQIVLHETSGELYMGHSQLERTSSYLRGESADLVEADAVLDQRTWSADAAGSSLRLEDIDLDKMFGQSATDLDDEAPHNNAQGSLEQWNGTFKGQGTVVTNISGDQDHRTPDDSAGLGITIPPSPDQPRHSLSAMARNKPPLPFLRRLDRYIPADLLDDINCEFHRLWDKGSDNAAWAPGSDECHVRQLAMNSIIQSQTGIPTNFADMAKDYSEVYRKPEEAGEADMRQAKNLAAFNMQWEYLKQDLHGSRLPLQSRRVLEPAPSFLDWFLEANGDDGSFRKHRQVKNSESDTLALVDQDPRHPLRHHANFLNQWVPAKSNTPPAVSLFAVITASRHPPVKDPYSHKAIVLSQAFKWVDPFAFDSDLNSIDNNLKGTALRDFATGRTTITYSPFGTWLQDSYSDDEDLPMVSDGSCEGVGNYDEYGWLRQYAGLQWPYHVRCND